MASRSKKKLVVAADGPAAIKEVLDAVAPRPLETAEQRDKNAYAIAFAEKMAEVMARDLSPSMKGIKATTKREAGGAKQKKKQLDINFSTLSSGLTLGISLKSVHLRESTGALRYTHNMKRNEEELRIEASNYHKRQPYAVMVGVLFLPFDSCTDARTKHTPSSFGSWVRSLRLFAGRSDPTDDHDRFERLYVALYEPDGTDFRFFDIQSAPPRNARPRSDGALFGPKGRDEPPLRLLSYCEFLQEIYHAYLGRNKADFVWADGEEEPLSADEIEELFAASDADSTSAADGGRADDAR